MNASDTRCDVVSTLIMSWHVGSLREQDRNAFEQHLLFCPPCLAQSDKVGLALTALAELPVDPPPELLRRLAERTAPRPRGG